MMNRKNSLLRLLAAVAVSLLLTVTATAQQQVVSHRQRAFPKTVPAGNYSGITWLGGSRYAVANDKTPTAGFHLMTLDIDSVTGIITHVKADTFVTSGLQARDEEGICYVPATNTVFVSGETDGQVVEYQMDGQRTGRRLLMPEVFSTAYRNRSLEALTYNARTHLFWTTSESTLRADGQLSTLENRLTDRLRLQSFNDSLQPVAQYWYETDSCIIKKHKGRRVSGVSGLAAMDDGRIVVLERELFFPKRKIGSFAHVRLYVVDPSRQEPGDTLSKTLLTAFRTKINLTNRGFANYEGICLGPTLADGRQLLILICDSQNQYKGMMKDWFKSVIIPSP